MMKLHKKTSVLAVAALGIFILSGQTMSASMTGKVNKLLVQPGTFGGCAATFTSDPQAGDAQCDANWLSFDCDGITRSKGDSALQWNALQLALVLDREVFVLFGANTRINGKCVAKRIDVIPPTGP